MARREAQKAVTAKMYRHFAAVTIVATVALAIATSESNADQFNATVDSQQAAIDAAGKELKKNARPKVVRRVDSVKKAPPAASGWGSDNSGDVSGGGDGFVSSYIPSQFRNKPMSVGMLRQLKLTPEQFMALSEEERKKVMERLHGAEPAVSPAEQARRQQSIAADSLSRGGFEGPCNDC